MYWPTGGRKAALVVINRKRAVQRSTLWLADLAENEKDLLMHLYEISIAHSTRLSICTQEFSDIDTTRGASSDDLFKEPLEPLCAGYGPPWIRLLEDLFLQLEATGLHWCCSALLGRHWDVVVAQAQAEESGH